MAKASNSLPHFQKRHYEAIALAIQDITLCADTDDKKRLATLVVNVFSEILAKDNPRFKLGRFERACVPGANVKARTNGGAR